VKSGKTAADSRTNRATQVSDAVGEMEPAGTQGASLPSVLSAHHVRRSVIKLSAVAIVAIVTITLLPGLRELRQRFANANPGWITVAAAAELLSVLAYVPAFRLVFCARMTWRTSYKIAMAEEGADSLLPDGGAGGLALGAWALQRGGMPVDDIARKTVAFFLLTSFPNVASLVLVGVGLAVGVLPGHASLALSVIPATAAAGAIGATLTLGRMIRRLSRPAPTTTARTRGGRLAAVLRATADGVEEAVAHLRTGNPVLLASLSGYMFFDILALWISFRALGFAPQLTIVWIAYLIGQLGNLIPLPGGIGGVELGLIGTLALYGLPALTATAAVLLYRVLELWIPAALGVVAFVQLRLLLRRNDEAIKLCDREEMSTRRSVVER
jgi:uncharacterized protein (TIRG00374 family)